MDLIDRQAAIDAIVTWTVEDRPDIEMPTDLVERINALPTAQPERKGKWNCSDDIFECAICSCCKWDSGEAWEYAKKYFRYCPNCGARMAQGGEDNERA